MKKITIEEIFKIKAKDLSLTLLSQKNGLKNVIKSSELHRPGLVFAGHFDTFDFDRIQVLGETEIKYLKSMTKSKRYDIIKEIFTRFKIPCIITSKGLLPDKELLFLADENGIPVFKSRLSTSNLMNRLSAFLQDYFAPSKSIHGTLVDVLGIGVLITGKSGIGKSECALSLISRGYRLIADDVIKIKNKEGIIVGEVNKKLGHFMEIRGIGLLDIETMFGIQAIRMQKRIEIQVELTPWRQNMDYERIGLKDRFCRILDVEIPIIYLPVSPGKNIVDIIEVVALNHMLKIYGHNAAKIFNEKIKREIERKNRTRTYLEEDKE
ncbi:MAG: HPr(Ser) kinase/phosphatase [Candidatus Cloacimonetes bacterium]|nr:HPr(Ser) kinase/phosphatase [Candidatus Cloacimonadota bacterium]MBL7107997.1 HPr(Ser) kinase/phosphatase [Candidatus Cloacimonadota bacterium]